MPIVHLSRALLDEIRTHGKETYPHECCGVPLGQLATYGGRIRAMVRAANTRTDSPGYRYQIAPADLLTRFAAKRC